MRRISTAVLSLSLACALASCGSAATPGGETTPGGESTPGGETAADDQPPSVVTYPGDGDDAGDGALLEGTVSFEGGCLVIVGPADERTIPAVPAGQAVQGTSRVSLYGIEIAVGDTVSFSGGFAGTTSGLTIPLACADLGYEIFHSWEMTKD